MNKFLKIIFLIIFGLLLFKWLQFNDYYNIDFRLLSNEEEEIFKWKDNYDEYLDHRNIYKSFFGEEKFKFPRQKVFKIKMLEKDKIFKTFWISKTLKKEKVDEIVTLFNNPINFDWGETTWGKNDVDYIFKFYDDDNKLIGKIDLCYHECGWVKSQPFSPNMKYGQISSKGLEKLFLIIYKLDCWN